ncbi:ABC transporter substrate-binding protein [Dokdonia pacifica]|uniref:Por secretion system C-terminal sorting domain-containing protein n=1 Tax=Dokdonia pacifica TaxID=1627892 RepID=A0A238WIH1_9FLAO|nr:T9SS type A sorting domain-containing protein [Dokdonia pacifica]GGG21473.1 ABC transporter substrate-binding protein [Dokdonia pacifica]SNR46362.1 Por secretion system C-terminal sorting domain-containing protein [Dokdonia pacifica]
MKQLYILLIVLFSLPLYSQDFSDEWTGYFSFASVGDIDEGNGRIYAASENAVFIFSTIDGSTITRSTINGLSGNNISSIYYSEAFDTLLVGYENGIIDVIVGNSENVITVVDIFNRVSIPPDRKRINHFTEFNGFVYISTGFGISLYDLGQLEFDDSYFIGDNGSLLDITQTAILDDYIYASSTEGGLRRAIVNNTNIIDFNNWSTVLNGSFQGITALDDTVYLANGSQLLESTTGTSFSLFQQLPEPIEDLEANGVELSVITENTASIYNAGGNLINSFSNIADFDDPYSASVIVNGSLFIATIGSGVIRVPLNGNEASQILPNGPLFNNPFNISATSNELWVVYGEYSVSYAPRNRRRGISHLVTETGWNNISEDSIFGARDLSFVAINPQNTSQVFVSSFGSGLLEINEEVPTVLYDENNSPLVGIGANNNSVRINGTAFDREGNLWVSNSRVPNILSRLSPDNGQFNTVNFFDDLPTLVEEANGIDDVTIAGDGRIYIGTSNQGVAGYDPNTGSFARIAGEEGAANLPNDDIRALTIDRNGSLWIGTRRGLRVLFAPSSIFTEPNVSTNAIIILQDGIPQELLNDQIITEIVVDGANNKWISTVDSGVFLFSPSGQETLQHFTEDNSPLPSNNVQDIALDPETGTVYFATLRGLVSFDGSNTGPAEDLEEVVVYPNPVRPTFNGEVTIEGLTARTNVKITDITGNLVYEENTVGGSITWDTRAFGRHRVASGVYLILITGPDALETQIAKLMIIR